ncbi:MAG: PQQ-binding-like beta-propeller repeat protein [Candidatus Eremiobacteraeota bacterium]|nr:PQQ-binding-like beta-propeller repeat protein [Candidatus Eremiobacteraeota bacterium]
MTHQAAVFNPACFMMNTTAMEALRVMHQALPAGGAPFTHRADGYDGSATAPPAGDAQGAGSISLDRAASLLAPVVSAVTPAWEFQTGDMVVSSPRVGPDGTVYVGSRDKKVYAINPDGTERWEFETDGWVGSSPSTGPDGTVYAGSGDAKVYALRDPFQMALALANAGDQDEAPAGKDEVTAEEGWLIIGDVRLPVKT